MGVMEKLLRSLSDDRALPVTTTSFASMAEGVS